MHLLHCSHVGVLVDICPGPLCSDLCHCGPATEHVQAYGWSCRAPLSTNDVSRFPQDRRQQASQPGELKNDKNILSLHTCPRPRPCPLPCADACLQEGQVSCVMEERRRGRWGRGEEGCDSWACARRACTDWLYVLAVCGCCCVMSFSAQVQLDEIHEDKTQQWRRWRRWRKDNGTKNQSSLLLHRQTYWYVIGKLHFCDWDLCLSLYSCFVLSWLIELTVSTLLDIMTFWDKTELSGFVKYFVDLF